MQISLAGRLALRLRLARHVTGIRSSPRMQACRAAHGTRKCSSLPTSNSLERHLSSFGSLMSVSRISCGPAVSARRMFAVSAEGEADAPAAAASSDAATTDEPAAFVTDAPPTAEDAPVESTKAATMAAQESAPVESAPRTAVSADDKLVRLPPLAPAVCLCLLGMSICRMHLLLSYNLEMRSGSGGRLVPVAHVRLWMFPWKGAVASLQGLARQRAEAGRQEGRRVFVANMCDPCSCALLCIITAFKLHRT